MVRVFEESGVGVQLLTFFIPIMTCSLERVAEGMGAPTGVDAHGASFFNGVNKASITKAIAHGLSRTAISQLRYGTTKGAFLSGFVSSGFSVGSGAGYKGAFVMAIVGGTVSELGGGKFSNGAMSSAFQYLFNDWAVSIDKNIELVKTISNGSKGSAVIDWIFRVKGGGVWDYKSTVGLELGEDLGNFNYGATGSALGFSEDTLLEAAGFVQILSGTARLDYINSNFDDPRDQAMIKLGIEYYKYYKGNK